MEPPGAVTGVTRSITKLLGKAVGYGLSRDVCDAYTFLMRTYLAGDQVFLFGFSRGAYTARVVAALLHMYGLIRPDNEPLVPYGVRMLTGVRDGAAFELAREFKATFSWIGVTVHFLGVWDTVSSVGWVENPLRVPFTANNPSVEISRHAVSIDERRAFFRTNLWHSTAPPKASGPKDLKQVWFAGVHCDVGGGYPEEQSGLSKIALEWMLCEARAAGLLIDVQKARQILGWAPESPFSSPNPAADAHESCKGWWRLAEFIPKRHYNWRKGVEERRMNLFRRRTIPDGSVVHESVVDRMKSVPAYHPPNLPTNYEVEHRQTTCLDNPE
jgi:uncharacterized protein (DUF2235 family)